MCTWNKWPFLDMSGNTFPLALPMFHTHNTSTFCSLRLTSLPFICTQLEGSSTTLYLPSDSGLLGVKRSNRSHERMSVRNNNEREKIMNDIDCWDSDALAPWYTHLLQRWNEWAVHIHFYTNCLNCNSQRCAFVRVCDAYTVHCVCTWTRLWPLIFTKMPNSTVIK